MLDLVIVTGPAGVGKSTVSRLVASSVERSAHLRMDDFMRSVVNGWVEPWRPEARHQNDVIGGAVVAAAMQLAGGGYTVVIDGTVFPQSLGQLARAGLDRNVCVHYAVLRYELSTCLDRAMRRDGQSPDTRRFADLHAKFRGLGAYERHVVDASGTREAVASAVLAGLRSGRLAAP